MDIRDFFQLSPASAARPSSGSAKSRKRVAAGAPSTAEVKRAKAVLAKAKKAKKAEKEDNFYCSPDLLEWKKEKKLYDTLNAMVTNTVKGYCRECGLAYGGPKYKLVHRVLEHVEEALRRQKFDAVRANAESDPAAAAQLLFSNVKSFKAACNLFAKQFAKLSQHKTSAAKLRTMIGLTLGFDIHLLKAITGPQAGKYNGKYDEIGIYAHLDVSTHWREFLEADGKNFCEEDWKLCANFVFEEQPTAAYGFDPIGYIGKNKGLRGFEEHAPAVWKATRKEKKYHGTVMDYL